MCTPRTDAEWMLGELRLNGLDAWVADETGRVLAATGPRPHRQVWLMRSEMDGSWSLTLSLGRSIKLDFVGVPLVDVAAYCRELLKRTP